MWSPPTRTTAPARSLTRRATAELTGVLMGGRNVTLAATTSHGMTTHAKTGAAGGKVAVVPSVAIALSNITTTATVGPSGTPLDIGGSFSATTDQSSSANTTAEGDAQGKSAAVGVARSSTFCHSQGVNSDP